MSLLILAKGFTLTLSMIAPIGTQNSMLLTQGISKNHHKTTAGLFMLYDAILISIGVLGGSLILSSSDTLFTSLTWGGIIFLAAYGGLSMKSAFNQKVDQDDHITNKKSVKLIVVTSLAVTFLNPHAYIDTVMVIGSVGGQYTGNAKLFFLVGAVLGSVVWFSLLATGAAKFSSYLGKPKVKRIIDMLIALVMWVIAWSLYNSWLARGVIE
ncbi:LysE/ArgO family amino acid transporter [uncultured Paraglaciecola sp.]|uniref:LysE/ArgO family amino acid transporter n=1 Tax=uncultured Paraglaciecola sp. TaxID=1765024 RepID=UPI0025CDB735|nr:LysE/ArgO family amino acid transporter [uncultured Paraglaciecola sp.]